MAAADAQALVDPYEAFNRGDIPAVLEAMDSDMTGARRVLGSVPNHVSHHARCDVLIVATA